MPQISIPLLKVSIERNGRVRLPNHALDTDHEWWTSVLSDPRLRSTDTHGWQDNLGRHPGGILTLKCERCPRSSRHQVDDLIVLYGAGCSCIAAAARILDDGPGCQRGRDCGLTYETTRTFRRPDR